MKNILCWLFGCDVKKDMEGGQRYSPSRGEGGPGMIDYCGPFGAKGRHPQNTTTIGNMVDRRNLYKRTIPVWMMKWKNRRFSKEFAEREKHWQSDEGRREYLAYLDKQSKKLKEGLI